MDHTLPISPEAAAAPEASLTLLEFNEWIGYQLDKWIAWAEANGEDWLSWPTLNERNPTLGSMFIHAFSPMHRYADQVVGDAPADGTLLHADAWIAVRMWAHQCVERHRDVCVGLPAGGAGRMVRFQTRTAGELHVSVGECLTHACTHCFWHLGGVAHMLRLGGKTPPQSSDLIFWAAEKHKLWDALQGQL